MERTDKEHILVLITNSFATLNVIHSGLIGELEKTYRVSIMSDILAEKDIIRLNRYFGLDMQLLATPVPNVPWLIRKLRALQMLVFGYVFDLDTVRIKLLERGAIWQQLIRALWDNRFLRSLAGLLVVLTRRWLINLTSHNSFISWEHQQHFAAVISSSPLDIRENKISNSLKVRGIRCISIIISWDNLTSKGVMNTKSDLVLVWNKCMAAEYERLYSIFDDKAVVRNTGIPRFDIYFKKPPSPQKLSHFRNQHRIDQQSRIILFSTGAVKHHACQNYIIHDLLHYAEAKSNIIILVRCHPHDHPERYREFRGFKNLLFFEPFEINHRHVKIPPPDFPETLNMHLQICTVCIQAASTMYLDAAACNRPTISIAYDAHIDTPYHHSVRRFYDYSHQRPLHGFLENRIVHSRADLFIKLDEILETRETSVSFRKAIIPLTHLCTPDATRFTAQCIQEWLD